MKELSIEEKAKAYDEALEKAKELMAKGYDVLMPELFPELKESEDECVEKIRKDIISYLNNRQIISISESGATEKWIAWLEKQGEQKLDWSEEDENNINSIVSRLEVDISYWESRSKTRTNEDKKLIGWLKSLRPQNRWKPSDEQLNTLKQAINAFPYETDYLELLYDDLKIVNGHAL